MALLAQQAFTLADYAARLGPNDRIGKIIEMMSQTNDIVSDALFLEANGVESHKTVRRSGLPQTYWRTLNRGVPRSKSQTVGVVDTMGMHEAWSVVDDDIVKINNDQNLFLLSEEMAFLEAMRQEIAKTMFYGNLEIEKASFTGLTAHYSKLSTDKTQSGYNVVDAGGTGSTNTSAWLLTWGDQNVHMIYPKGSKSGLEREYLGRKEVVDADGNEFMGHKTHYKWNIGMTVRDWRSTVRIANIDVSGLDTIIDQGASTPASQKLLRVLLDAKNRIPSSVYDSSGGRRFWYMNKTVKTMLDIIAMEKPNVTLNLSTFEGKPVTMLWGIPIHECDALIETEDRVTA